MIQINLLPWREDQRKLNKKHFLIAIAASIAAAIFLIIIWHLILSNRINHQQIRNDRLQQKNAQLNTQLTKYRKDSKEKPTVAAQLQILANLRNHRFQVVHMLDELVRTVPKEVYVTSIAYKQATLAIKGEAQNDAQIDQFMDNLKSSPWFTQPSLNEIVATQENKQYKRAFQIVTQFKQTKE